MTLTIRNGFRRIPMLVTLTSCVMLSACMGDRSEEALRPMAYGGSDRHPIKVSADGSRAYVKNCEDAWSEDVAATNENSLLEGHGCAVQKNIASMVANPRAIKRKPKSPGYWYANTIASPGAQQPAPQPTP